MNDELANGVITVYSISRMFVSAMEHAGQVLDLPCPARLHHAGLQLLVVMKFSTAVCTCIVTARL